MSDQKPPGGFNWGLGGPAKPEDPAEPPTPPETKYPAPPVTPQPVPPPLVQPAAPTASPPPVYSAPPAYSAPPPLVAPPAPPLAAAPPAPPPAVPPAAAAPPAYAAPPATPAAPPAPPPASWDQPTQAFDYRAPAAPPPPASSSYDQLTQPYSFDTSINGATEVLGAQPVGLPELRDEGVRPSQSASAIDSLFGESQFKEYEDTALPAEGFGALASGRPREPREPMGRTQRMLLIAAGGLVAALILVGVFMLGTTMPGILPQPEAKPPVVEETKAPVAAPPVVGPVAAGTYEWNELLGTECLEPFGNAWDEEFTVVDCATPHTAQLVYRGIFGDEAFAPYPEASELEARINLLCTAPTSINYAAAGALSDIAVSASYPASAEQWDAGEREYFCFLTRSSGEPLTVSLANAPVAETAPVASIPSTDP